MLKIAQYQSKGTSATQNAWQKSSGIKVSKLKELQRNLVDVYV